MAMVLLSAERRWSCPNCTTTKVTRDPRIPIGSGAAVLHHCRGLRGIIAPLVPDGMRCKVEAVQREDYVGREVVRHDGEGKAIQALVTTRDDGMDCAVLAPMAAGGRAG